MRLFRILKVFLKKPYKKFLAHQELLDLIDEHQLEKLASDHEEEHRGALRNIFSEIMNSPQDTIKRTIDALIERLSKSKIL